MGMHAVVSWPHPSLFHDIKNLKAMHSSPKQPVIGTGLHCKVEKQTVQELWRDFFSDPSQWWDNRLEKVNPRYPDFRHKKTQVSLWLNSKSKPSWVEAELAALAPGTIQFSTFSWNKVLARFTKAGEYEKTLQLFQEMQTEGICPDKFTFVPVFNSCAGLQALEEGRSIHKQIMKSDIKSDIFVCNSLMDMYTKCDSIGDAWRVFNQMPTKDVVSWNVMIGGHVKCGQGQKALELSQQMQQEGIRADVVTFVGVLKACASTMALEEGRSVHQQIVQRGWESDAFLGCCLINMYGKCGSVEDAWRVFSKISVQDVFSWSAMIRAFVKCGEGQKALRLYQQMQQEGVGPDIVTLVGVLNACASVKELEEGKRVHEEIIERGWESDGFVRSCLLDMYAKCGSIKDAWRVFHKMPTRDVVVWTTMILGCVRCGQGQHALELFRQMQREQVEPNIVTFIGVLKACSSLAALKEGRHAHGEIIHRSWESNVFVGSCLVDMYAKCGSIEDAQRVFNKMSIRPAVTWNSMLQGYARHGYAKEALQHFEQMCTEGVEVDGVTFVSLLSACSHAGLVGEGVHYFESLSSVYSIQATVEHYACVVNLLGRAGHLQEAESLIQTMSCEPDSNIWMALLSACGLHGNLEMGARIAQKVFELDSGSPAGYVLLSNLYAAAGNSDRSAIVKSQMLKRCAEQTGLRCIISCNYSLKRNKSTVKYKIFGQNGRYSLVK